MTCSFLDHSSKEARNYENYSVPDHLSKTKQKPETKEGVPEKLAKTHGLVEKKEGRHFIMICFDK